MEWVIWENLAIIDLSGVIPWVMLIRFEHNTLWIRAEQRNYSTMAASTNYKRFKLEDFCNYNQKLPSFYKLVMLFFILVLNSYKDQLIQVINH